MNQPSSSPLNKCCQLLAANRTKNIKSYSQFASFIDECAKATLVYGYNQQRADLQMFCQVFQVSIKQLAAVLVSGTSFQQVQEILPQTIKFLSKIDLVKSQFYSRLVRALLSAQPQKPIQRRLEKQVRQLGFQIQIGLEQSLPVQDKQRMQGEFRDYLKQTYIRLTNLKSSRTFFVWLSQLLQDFGAILESDQACKPKSNAQKSSTREPTPRPSTANQKCVQTVQILSDKKVCKHFKQKPEPKIKLEPKAHPRMPGISRTIYKNHPKQYIHYEPWYWL